MRARTMSLTTARTVLGAVALWSWVCAVGCSASYPEGRITCDSDGDCPSGWFCNGARCFSMPSARDAGTELDAIVDAAHDAGADDVSTEDTGVVDTGVNDAAQDAGRVDAGDAGQTDAPVGDACACHTGEMCCGGTCLDVTMDPENCTACGNRCPANEACMPGVGCACLLASCAGDCLPFSATSCSCDTQCVLSRATARCTTGTCQVVSCAPGWVNRDLDPSNGCECPSDCTMAGFECGTVAVPGCPDLNCGTCPIVHPLCNMSTHMCGIL